MTVKMPDTPEPPLQPPPESDLAADRRETTDRLVVGQYDQVVRIASTEGGPALTTSPGTWGIGVPPGEYAVQIGEADPVLVTVETGEAISLEDLIDSKG